MRRQKITNEEFIKKLIQVHGNEFDYSKVEFTKLKNKITVICKIHGEFYPTATCHLNGTKCRICENIKNSKLAADKKRFTQEEFIKKCSLIHNNEFDYSKVKYLSSHDEIILIHKKCNTEYSQKAFYHLKGDGCKICTKSKLLENNKIKFLEKARKIWGNEFDYSKLEYKTHADKIIVICKTHGDFEVIAGEHVRTNRAASGCPTCIKDKIHKETINSIKEQFIIKAKKIHLNKFDYSTMNYNGCNNKIKIICNVHGVQEMYPTYHLRSKYGCYDCYINNKRKSQEQYIKEAKKLHNNLYLYDKISYTNSNSIIDIFCIKHNKYFTQSAGSHLNGRGCPDCGIESRSNFQRLSADECINRFKSVHGDLYDYSKIKYKTSGDKLEIICKIHGSFWQSYYSHFGMKTGCPKCGFEKTANKIRHDTDWFIEAATKKYQNIYDYSKSQYKTIKDLIIIKCKKHSFEFKITPSAHIYRDVGCPKCCLNGTSKPEIEWLNSMNIADDELHRQVKLKINNKTIRVDGYDPTIDTIYEFYGDFWHGNPKIYKPDDINIVNKKSFGELYDKTIIRENFIKTNGYKLVTIWESDYRESKNEAINNLNFY